MYTVYPESQHKTSHFDIFNVDIFNIVFVAVIASLASFLNRQAGPEGQEPRKWSWLRFFAHLSASIISALLASNVAMYMGVDHERVLFAIAGVCGWAGKEGVDWMIYAIRMKVLNFAGLSKEAGREAHRYDMDSAPQRTRGGYNEMADTPNVPVIDTTDNVGSLRKKKNIAEEPPKS